MIPNFSAHGLLPKGVHDCTLSEIELRFCWTPRRRALFSGLQRFISDEIVPAGLHCPLWIDGSFVRNKPEPNDIDIVLDLTHLDDIGGLATAMAIRLRWQEIMDAYNLDVWTRHPRLPNDLTAFFQCTGDKAAAELRIDKKHPKGVIRILEA